MYCKLIYFINVTSVTQILISTRKPTFSFTFPYIYIYMYLYTFPTRKPMILEKLKNCSTHFAKIYITESKGSLNLLLSHLKRRDLTRFSDTDEGDMIAFGVEPVFVKVSSCCKVDKTSDISGLSLASVLRHRNATLAAAQAPL